MDFKVSNSIFELWEFEAPFFYRLIMLFKTQKYVSLVRLEDTIYVYYKRLFGKVYVSGIIFEKKDFFIDNFGHESNVIPNGTDSIN